MNTTLTVAEHTNEFSDVLDDLHRLSRAHILAFRLEVGTLLLDRFYGGSIEEYRSQDPFKSASFQRFVTERHDDLREFGLAESSLRNCILARHIFDGLPPAVKDSVKFSHLVELTRVQDPMLRARLAMSSLQNGWRVTELKTAVASAKAGTWYDTDPSTPGTQPPPPQPLPEHGLSIGRLIARAEKWNIDFDAWSEDWNALDLAWLSPPRRTRMLTAVALLRSKLAGLEESLAPVPRPKK